MFFAEEKTTQDCTRCNLATEWKPFKNWIVKVEKGQAIETQIPVFINHSSYLMNKWINKSRQDLISRANDEETRRKLEEARSIEEMIDAASKSSIADAVLSIEFWLPLLNSLNFRIVRGKVDADSIELILIDGTSFLLNDEVVEFENYFYTEESKFEDYPPIRIGGRQILCRRNLISTLGTSSNA